MSSPEKYAPGYELFMAPLQVVLNPTELDDIEFAYTASKHGHKGQFREGGGPFSEHPKTAAWIYTHELGGRDPRVITDLLLHDILEDSYLFTLRRIALNFGKEIALDVRALTKLKRGKETTEQYLKRIIAQGRWAIISKLCDRLHNLRSLKGCPAKKIRAQIKETRAYHVPFLLPALHSFGEPWSGYAEILKREIEKTIRSLLM
jgi:(p)ppGpp synthase/HD superfamily hydrolase